MTTLKAAYAYDLPEELIAAEPVFPRDSSRMLILDRSENSIQHGVFHQVTDFLDETTLLVLNDTRVIPARLPGKRLSGGAIEVLLLQAVEQNIWQCMVKNASRVKAGEELKLCDGMISAVMIRKEEEGMYLLDFHDEDSFFASLEKYGYAPLPPYIHKVRRQETDRLTDLKNYQTVFAREYGAIAAPTAGLHFTREILDRLRQKNVPVITVTLHVGAGTFEPIRGEDARDHKMHEEFYSVSEAAAEAINNAKDDGKKIVAVGTTVCRTLEAAAVAGRVRPGTAKTNLFIYPPYRFQIIDQLITNFHLPESTLMMLVSAFATRESILAAYREAVSRKYRFFSYGDCMFIR